MKKSVCFIGVALLSAIAPLTADVKENPYQSIAERNAFGLKPPPQIVDSRPLPPPTPQATVELTGITSILSKTKALLEITEPGPGKTPKKPIMEEGDRIDSIEVISIDVEKGQVRIRNAGVETNLTFKVSKSASTVGAPGAPPPPILGVPPAVPGKPVAAGPTIISGSASADSDRGGVTLLGGGAPTATTGTGVTTAPGVPPSAAPNFGATATATFGTAQPGLRSIPSRQIRAEAQGVPAVQQRPTSPEEAIAIMEARREAYRAKGSPPLPPAKP